MKSRHQISSGDLLDELEDEEIWFELENDYIEENAKEYKEENGYYPRWYNDREDIKRVKLYNVQRSLIINKLLRKYLEEISFSNRKSIKNISTYLKLKSDISEVFS